MDSRTGCGGGNCSVDGLVCAEIEDGAGAGGDDLDGGRAGGGKYVGDNVGDAVDDGGVDVGYGCAGGGGGGCGLADGALLLDGGLWRDGCCARCREWGRRRRCCSCGGRGRSGKGLEGPKC